MLELLKVFFIKDERILSGFKDACCLDHYKDTAYH